MKARLWICLVVGLLALSILPAAAQDTTEEAGGDFDLAALNCLGLSDEDCAIVATATDNIETIESFTLEFSFSQSTGNTEGMAGMGGMMGMGGPTEMQGTATVAIDHAAMSEDDPMAGVSIALNFTASSTTSDGVETIESSVVIVDGNVYVQNADTGEWTGTSLQELADNPEALAATGLGDMSVMGMPMGMGDMMDMGSGAMSGEGMGGMMDEFGLGNILSIPGFLNQSRLDDETVDGVNEHVFAYTADLGALFQNPDVQTAISGLMAAASDTGSENPMAQQMGAMIPVLLENTTGTVTVTRWIGADDQLPHALSLDAQVAIDLFGGASGDNTPIPPITISVTADIRLTDINNTPAPTAPEGATLVPAEEFLGTGEATAEATP